MRVTADGVIDGPKGQALPWGELAQLQAIAEKAARRADQEFAEQFGMRPGGDREDLVQEGLTWLLEYPGRAWVRAADGTMQDPEEQMVTDLVEHLQRTF